MLNYSITVDKVQTTESLFAVIAAHLFLMIVCFWYQAKKRQEQCLTLKCPGCVEN